MSDSKKPEADSQNDALSDEALAGVAGGVDLAAITSNIPPSPGGGEGPTDSVSLNFSKLEIPYKKQP